MKKIFVVVIAVILLIIGAWSYLPLNDKIIDNNQTPPSQNNSRTTLANPASEFCLAAGGHLEAATSSAGERNDCVFPTANRCDEWVLFRGECNIPEVSQTASYSNGSSTVTVIYRLLNETALITSADFSLDHLELKVAPSGSGARYLSEDSSIEFWEHQGEGRLTIGNKEVFVGPIDQTLIDN
jgi:putative hemolysin